MLTLFPLLLCNASYIIYGKRRLVKNDGGLVNVYNLICEAGVQTVLNANGEPKETSKSETTQTLNLRVYFLFCFLDFCAAVDAEWQLSSAFFYVFNVWTTHPAGFPLSFFLSFSTWILVYLTSLTTAYCHSPIMGPQHHRLKAVGEESSYRLQSWS